MLLALVVLAVFVLFYIFAFDAEMQGGGQTIESVIASQAEDITNIRLGISRCEEELRDLPKLEGTSKRLVKVNRENQSRSGVIASLEDGVVKANDSLSAKIEEFEAYKDVYRAFVRGEAKGMTMDRLETREGKVYENVTIREVTAIGVQIRFDGGLRRIPFEEMPEDMQDHFQFDKDQKESAVAREIAIRNKHEAAVLAAKSAAQEQRSEFAEKKIQETQESNVRTIAIKESQITTCEEQIRNLESAIRLEGTKGVSRAPQMRIQMEEVKRKLSSLRSEVSQLRANL